MSAESTVSSAGPHTPQSERTLSLIHSTKGVPGITTVLEAFHRDMCHDDRRLDPHNVEAVARDVVPFSVVSTNPHNVQKETVDGGGVRRVTTTTSITVLISYFSSMTMSEKGNCAILVLCSHRSRLLPFRTSHPNPR